MSPELDGKRQDILIGPQRAPHRSARGFPTTGIEPLCCARAASGHTAAAAPNNDMNARRLMEAPLRLSGRTLPHRFTRTPLCITAKIAR
jgi:hypothetical protein